MNLVRIYIWYSVALNTFLLCWRLVRPARCEKSPIREYYSDVIMGVMASQTASLPVVSWTVYSGVAQRKHQSSASLAFVRGIHRRPVNSLHKWPVTRKMFPFDDVIMKVQLYWDFISTVDSYASLTRSIVCLDNGTLPVRCQAIYQANADFPWITSRETDFNEKNIEINKFLSSLEHNIFCSTAPANMASLFLAQDSRQVSRQEERGTV